MQFPLKKYKQHTRCLFAMIFVNFDIVWRYFSWTNQTLAAFTLWAGTVYLFANGKRLGYLIALFPALFMTMVSVSYIFIAPEGFHLPIEYRWIGYAAAALVTIFCLTLFCLWARRQLQLTK